MKLIDDFFEVLEASRSGTGFSTIIKFNPGHIVYKGHFPGYPVTPGVIQMQIVHELLEMHLSKKLNLKTMPNCKFLKVLNPLETPQITIHVKSDEIERWINVKASGEKGDNVFFKFSAVYEVYYKDASH